MNKTTWKREDTVCRVPRTSQVFVEVASTLGPQGSGLSVLGVAQKEMPSDCLFRVSMDEESVR
jgi:hypothetical protein